MQNLVNKILRILKDHVNQNNQEIQYNQDEINRLMSRPDQKISDNDLEYKNALNKELLGENEEFIQMQIQISEFLEKYGHLFPDDEHEEDDFYEQDDGLPYFTKTVNGQIQYGPDHPQFNNIRFFNELLKYYQEREDYEKCDQLLKIKKL